MYYVLFVQKSAVFAFIAMSELMIGVGFVKFPDGFYTLSGAMSFGLLGFLLLLLFS